MEIPEISLSTILFIISTIAIIFCFSIKNNNFFDVRMVFKQHFQIFENAPLQKFVFNIVPLLMAFAIVDVKSIDKDIINNLIIVLSIFISMFFAMLSILISISFKENDNIYNKLLKETFNTITFEIILSLILLILSFIQLFLNDFSDRFSLKIISFLIYYLTIVVVLNTLVVVKRIKVLFDNR